MTTVRAGEALALAPAQELIWEFIRCFAPDDPGAEAFNVVQWADWPTAVDRRTFRRAVADVLARHDALQTVFVTSGVDPTIRFDADLPVAVHWHDLIDLDAEAQLKRLAAIDSDNIRRRFDLHAGPLWTVDLVRLEPGRHVVAVGLSHMICDGWSVNVLLNDMAAAYRHRVGAGPVLPELRLGYHQLIGRQEPTAAQRAARSEYWRRSLDPLPDRFAFPALAPEPGANLTASAAVRMSFRTDTPRDLATFAARVRTTPFITLLAAYRIILAGWTGWDRVVIGTNTTGRRVSGSQDVVGQFTANIYLGTSVTPDSTLMEVLGRVHEEMLLAVRHAAPYKELARAVHPGFEATRPWPFLHLYDAWFQSAAANGAESAADRGAGPALADAGRAASRDRWAACRPTCPKELTMRAKRGEPGFILGSDLRSARIVRAPAFYPTEMVAAVTGRYPAVLQALLNDPHQRVRDVLRVH